MKKISLPIIFALCLLKAQSQNIDTAFKYFDAGRYERAAMEFEKVLPFIEKLYGSTDTSYYSFYLYCTAVSYERNYQYARAEIYYSKINVIYEKIGAVSCTAYSIAVYNLAELYRKMGRYEDAESLYLQALEKSSSITGETGPVYIRLLDNFISLYHRTANYIKAEPLYLKALGINKKVFGEEHPNTFKILNNLGTLYDDMGNYPEAESIYQKMLAIRKKSPGTESPGYVISANNLAQLYFKMGNYEKAEPLYQQALSIIKRIYGEEHLTYATALNNLGALYFSKGSYDKAESLFLGALKIREKILGTKNPDYATSLSNLALFYDETGDYEKAGSLYTEAADIRREALGKDHPGYAVTLNNMALFYSARGNLEKAEPLLMEALAIRKNSLGEEHPDYAVSLNNLALFYGDSGDYKMAEPLFLQALEIDKKVMGEMHPNYAGVLNNLAELYDKTGDDEKAEAMYLHALEIYAKISGENNPEYASVLSNLALLYQERGSFDKAEQMYEHAMDVYLSQISQQFSFLSENGKEKYLAKIQFFFSTYQNFILQQNSANPAIGGKAYDIELSFKGLLLKTDKQLRNFVINSGDSAITTTYDSWISVRASLARQYSMPSSRQAGDIKPMEDQANELEKKLTRLYSEKSNLRGLQDIHWKDVQKQLGRGEAAIEFTSVPFFNGKKWTDSIMYVAILLKRYYVHPVIVPLFEIRQLDTLLKRGMSQEFNFINRLYGWTDPDNQPLPGKGQQLYNLIWKPLEKSLEGIRTVYFSPSGRLHQLSFAAIPCSAKDLLSDRYQMVHLSSTGQLTLKLRESTVRDIVLFGGIEYDADVDKMEVIAGKYRQSAEKPALEASRSPAGENTRSGSFMYLDGTLAEVEAIKKLTDTGGITAAVITGNDAVEESVKSLYGKTSPDVIHIATHGFFFPDAGINFSKNGLVSSGGRVTQGFRSSDIPLMRSGLALAGANHVWNKEVLPRGIDDGILTAYEVSNMYIPNTELVVLSACETGLGDIKGSEGVFGLQRAFKMAGSRNILMSLWQIPDYQTSELMVRFYTEWFSGKPVGEALRLAQNFMKSKYPQLPYMWAAFVLVR